MRGLTEVETFRPQPDLFDIAAAIDPEGRLSREELNDAIGGYFIEQREAKGELAPTASPGLEEAA